MNVIELRRDRYDALFAGELPYEPLPEDAEVGLSGLCSITRRSGKRISKLQVHLDELPTLVHDILATHQAAAQGEVEAQAIFGFIDTDSQNIVTDIVTNVFSQWEIAHGRRGARSCSAGRQSSGQVACN